MAWVRRGEGLETKGQGASFPKFTGPRFHEMLERAQLVGEELIHVRRRRITEDRSDLIHGASVGKPDDARRPALRGFHRRPAPPVDDAEIAIASDAKVHFTRWRPHDRAILDETN